MAFNLETARIKIGLTAVDTSKDLLLTMGLNAALAIAENYCDRYFIWKRDVARFLSPPGPRLQLKRYPITYVQSVGEAGEAPYDSSSYKVHHIHGYITRAHHHHNYTHRSDYHWYHGREIEVVFEGGYKIDDLPADLELALWGIFDVVWLSLTSTSTGAVGTLPTGAIASINIPDVGSVSFTQNSAVASANVHLAGNALFGQYGPFFHLLDSYRDEPC